MRVRTLETPALTGKIWDNELFRLTDHVRGDGHSDIMDNIAVGDTYFNGVGHEFICIHTHVTKADMLPYLDGREIGQNWAVTCHPIKKDGTLHLGQASNKFEHSFFSWEQK